MGQLNCIPQDQSIEEESKDTQEQIDTAIEEAEAGATTTSTVSAEELEAEKTKNEELMKQLEELNAKLEQMETEGNKMNVTLEKTITERDEAEEKTVTITKQLTSLNSQLLETNETNNSLQSNIEQLEQHIQKVTEIQEEQMNSKTSFVLSGSLRKFRKKGKGRPVPKHVQFIHDEDGKNYVSYAEDETSEQLKRFIVESVSTNTKTLEAEFESGQIKRMILLKTKTKTIPLICADSTTRDDWFYKINEVVNNKEATKS